MSTVQAAQRKIFGFWGPRFPLPPIGNHPTTHTMGMGIRGLKMHIPAVRGDNLIQMRCLDRSAKPFLDSDRGKVHFLDCEVPAFLGEKRAASRRMGIPWEWESADLKCTFPLSGATI